MAVGEDLLGGPPMGTVGWGGVAMVNAGSRRMARRLLHRLPRRLLRRGRVGAGVVGPVAVGEDLLGGPPMGTSRRLGAEDWAARVVVGVAVQGRLLRRLGDPVEMGVGALAGPEVVMAPVRGHKGRVAPLRGLGQVAVGAVRPVAVGKGVGPQAATRRLLVVEGAVAPVVLVLAVRWVLVAEVGVGAGVPVRPRRRPRARRAPFRGVGALGSDRPGGPGTGVGVGEPGDFSPPSTCPSLLFSFFSFLLLSLVCFPPRRMGCAR